MSTRFEHEGVGSRTGRVVIPRLFRAAASLLVAAGVAGDLDAQAPHFEVTIPAAVHAGALTGRLVIAISRTAQPEPRLLISMRGSALVAVDLEKLPAGKAASVDATALGYPGGLATLPPGDYFAQAAINVYEEVHRSDGRTLWLHMNTAPSSSSAMRRATCTATWCPCTSAMAASSSFRRRMSFPPSHARLTLSGSSTCRCRARS